MSKNDKSQPKAIRKLKEKKEQKEQSSLLKEVQDLDASCRDLLSKASALSPYLVKTDLIQAGDIEQINNYAQMLTRDTIEFKNQLDAIRASIPRDLNNDDPDDIALAIEIGEHYQSWQERYQRVVVPTIEQLSQLLQQAAKNYDEKNRELDNE